MNLDQALAHLDPANDEHWTADGLPRMDVVAEISGNAGLKRKDVTNAAPELTRSTAPELVYEDAVEEDDDEPEQYPAEELETEDGEEEEETEEEESEEETETEETEEEPEEEVEESVMALPLHEVLGSYPLTMRAQAEITEKTLAAVRAREAIGIELDQLAAKYQVLRRSEIHLVRADPSLAKTDPVRDYLNTVKKAKAERVARTRKFMESGVTPQEVAAELNSKSPLDQAMGLKRGGPGTKRPAVRVPNHGN